MKILHSFTSPRPAMQCALWHVQVIPVRGMGLMSRSAASSGDVFVASSSGDAGVVRLAPLPFAQQAKALADRNELSAALEMAALVPSTQVRSQLLAVVRSRTGFLQANMSSDAKHIWQKSVFSLLSLLGAYCHVVWR